MKHLSKLAAIFAALALTCAFIGCSDGSSSDDNNNLRILQIQETQTLAVHQVVQYHLQSLELIQDLFHHRKA